MNRTVCSEFEQNPPAKTRENAITLPLALIWTLACAVALVVSASATGGYNLAAYRYESKLLECERRVVRPSLPDPSATPGCPIGELSGPFRLKLIIYSLLIANQVRWELIDPFSNGLTPGNAEEHFQRLETTLRCIKGAGDQFEILTGPAQLVDAFDSQEDVETINRLYAEFSEIDSELSDAIRERDVPRVCEQLDRWRRNNSDFLELASRRLQELVAQMIDHSVFSGACANGLLRSVHATWPGNGTTGN